MEAEYEWFTTLAGAEDVVGEVVGRKIGLGDSWGERKRWT
jgi:hypothetical protein